MPVDEMVALAPGGIRVVAARPTRHRNGPSRLPSAFRALRNTRARYRNRGYGGNRQARVRCVKRR